MNKGDLEAAITQHRGIIYFREKMGYKLSRKPPGYWSEKIASAKLELIIEELGHFPTQQEISKMKKGDLQGVISRYGGMNHFRELLGYKITQKNKGYWNEKRTINELESMIEELGYFPTQQELYKMNRIDLVSGISRNGGFDYFKKLLGYELFTKPKNYWNEETIISELKPVIEKVSHFPTQSELIKLNRNDLNTAITRYGGVIYFRSILGFTYNMKEEYISQMMSYIGKRGKKSEQVVKEIIIEWSDIHNKSLPNFNVKLAKGNILEFVCNSNLRVGIDVTNTKASRNSTINTISNKWKHKEYHLHLDELWIVVFTDVLSPEDYNTLNMKSPDNVKVFSIEAFLEELDYSTEYCDMNKIDNLKNCSFHNKEEIIGINRSVGEQYA